MKIAALFNQENVLPTAPKVVQELIESFDNEGVSTDDLARRIALDPVLSANLLRLANSAYYRASRRVSSVDAAVTMLGFVTVRTLVITCSLVSRFKTTPGIDLRQFWRYSLSTAVACRWLAEKCGEDTELAFTIGVVHAIGELMMHLGMPEESTTLDKIANPYSDSRLQMERDVFGFNYSDVSAELLARWKFPDAIVAAIRASSRAFDPQDFNRQAAILHLASWAARTGESHVGSAAMRDKCPIRIVELLGLPPYAMLDQMPPLVELRADLEELMP